MKVSLTQKGSPMSEGAIKNKGRPCKISETAERDKSCSNTFEVVRENLTGFEVS